MKYTLFYILIILPFVTKAADVVISGQLPSTAPLPPGPLGIVDGFYQFALMIGGLLAFGAIVYGGIKYAIAAGNSEGQSDAKDRIVQALLGLVLLLGANLLLRTINPGITNLSLAPLSQIKVLAPEEVPVCKDCKAPKQCLAIGNGKSECRAVTCSPACTNGVCTKKDDGTLGCMPIIRNLCTVETCPYNCNATDCLKPQACLPTASGLQFCQPICGTTGCPKGQVCNHANGRYSCETAYPQSPN